MSSYTALFAHLLWLAVGPILLILGGFLIAKEGAGWFSPLSLGYLAVAILIILARWFETRSGKGSTSTGDPLTPENFRSYLKRFIPIAIAVWSLSNIVGKYLFKGTGT